MRITYLLIEISKYAYYKSNVIRAYADRGQAEKDQKELERTMSPQYPCTYIILETHL